jgi:hypothetical protein|tara:strand:- start:118 stop:555 length:438 start_codon:yes stop_codon:yes gene_type:complete
MAITTSAVANTFKNQLLSATHNFTQTSGNHFYLALYTSSAVLGKSTTDYTTSGESSGTGYAAGGLLLAVAGQTHKLASDTAIVDWTNLSWQTATITARGALIYNKSSSDKAVCVLDFGGDKTATAGTFTIQFPNFTDTLAILRIA